MARNLYRFYLYAVFVVMLGFATAGLAVFLQSLLALTALRGSYSSPPTSAIITQTGVFLGVSWFFAALIGGLHYWLIRRDMRNDPAAGSSAIRSFFLNVMELIAAPIAVGAGAATIGQLGQLSNGPDVSSSAAFTIALLALIGVLEWERRRATAATPVGLFFQRFNLYGVQFVLLNVLIAYGTFALNLVVDALFFNGATYGVNYCGGSASCQGPNAWSNAGAALWVALFWLAYGYAGRNEHSSLLQRIAYYISFAYGVGFTLYGVGQAVALGILNISGGNIPAQEVIQSYNFTASLLLGLLILGVYTFWLRSATRRLPVPSAEWQMALSIEEAILAALMAIAFYAGLALVLLNIFELPVSAHAWAIALAFVITGIAYVALDVHLHRRRRQELPGALDARRAFVFALLGSGILAAGIGGSFALYAVISAALGSPLANWQHLARAGAAAVAVGLVVLAIYFLQANREKLFAGLTRRAARIELPEAAPQVVEAMGPAAADAQTVPLPARTMEHFAIEEVLDELLAGKLSRDEAATRIRELTGVK